MCHAWEYELIRKAYAEEMQRRRRQEEAAQPKGSMVDAPKPREPQPGPRDTEPVPA